MAQKNKSRSKRIAKTITQKALKKEVFHFFLQNPLKPLNYKQLSKKIGISDPILKKKVNEILHELAKNEKIEEVKIGKFRLKSIKSTIIGTVDLTSDGNAYIVSDEVEEDIFVSQSKLNHALHGDTVMVNLFAKRKRHKFEGEITEILKRSRTRFVGTVEVSKNFAFLIPDNKNMPYDLFIPKQSLNNAKNHQKAIAEIVEWPQKTKNPVGKIVEVLGEPGENEVEMHAILAEFDLPYHFPEKVLAKAEEISEEISTSEIKKRKDFRKVTTFTIDPHDAKDFDDALSMKKLDSGNWEVGIHIADVTHYVRPNTLLDNEAYGRGTSVYLVDRVVPMLPERLSNKICSLRPNEDKLCFSAVFELNSKAQVLSQWFGKTIINSDRRFAYEEAQEIIENGVGELSEEMLELHKLAQKLRNQRFKEGAIDFDRAEVKFKLDEAGKPVDVYFKEQKESNKLIEEFMLLANKRVAEFIGQPKPDYKPKTFVYRIHDEPDFGKLANFSEFIKKFGYSINLNSSKEVAASLNKLLDKVEGKQEQNVIEQLAIRSMAKAVYSTQNIGHYGLNFPFYTHFTSPIRRYPDMMVHRLLEKYLEGAKSVKTQAYEVKCKHTSDMERRAVLAERASDKYKMVEFMSDKLGFVYDGVISGVTEWGLYVEIVENKIEGMIPIKDLDDDFYIFDEKNYCLVGYNNKKTFQIGDNIKIQIVRTDLQKKQLDFILYSEDMYN